MKDILEELAGEIKKSQEQPKVSDRQRVHQFYANRQPAKSRDFVKARGPGGIIFDFGRATGNPIADGATALLNHFADPIQENIVREQNRAFEKAVMQHVTGEVQCHQEEERDAVVKGLVHAEWNKQLSKSFDQQTAEHVQKHGLGESGGGLFVAGEFNKSQVKVGDDVAVAQSETDAAVIEMMKAEMAMMGQGVSDGGSR